jgi:hypothetical protein
MRKLIVIGFLSVLVLVSIKITHSAHLPADLIGSSSSIESMIYRKGLDYWIEVIEDNGIQLATITTFLQHNCRPHSTFRSHDSAMSTCLNIFANVIKGPVELDFATYDGRSATIIVNAGNAIEFKPYSFTISSPISNSDLVLVITDGVEYLVHPGESNQIVKIDIMSVNTSDGLNQLKKQMIPVVIFGSAYLDVSTIEITSLTLEGMSVKMDDQSNNPATIDLVNGDPYPDLVVNFENNETCFSKGSGYVILTGNLSDGTIISGNDFIFITEQTN